MSIINKLSSGMTEAGNTISQKAKGITEQTKLIGEISKKKASRDEYIRKLGEACYQSHKIGEAFDFDELFYELELIDGVLEKMMESLCQLKGIVICENCGMEVAKGSAFCPSCGNPVKRPSTIRCSKCGMELPSGTRFCVQCGTKIEE